ncbi:PHP-associated domain-containing protein [Halospeciosus flavus]|uniref:PHP-associated domain-containing protein n=1 Tax=Halospeciosus flavus TaxID=3032283 RepID=A0ABD5Z5B3_9EURY|nr:PHP-associated domain-containing protein [Halospeciosus flavus]
MTGCRVDFHVKVLDEQVVKRAKARGLDALVYAPHFTRLPDVRERAERFSDDELSVIPAREVFTGDWQDRRHVLVLGLDDPVPDFITFEGAMAEFERQGAAVLVPHPTFLSVSFSASDVERYVDLIDAVETYNPKHLQLHNRRARRLARNHSIPEFGSSYAHLRGTVGEVWTAFDHDVTTEEALVEALRTGASRAVDHRTGVAHQLRRHAEMAHLGYENTYEKVDRLLLSGMEPTHPRHIAYEGRFDDVRVY